MPPYKRSEHQDKTIIFLLPFSKQDRENLFRFLSEPLYLLNHPVTISSTQPQNPKQVPRAKKETLSFQGLFSY